MDTKSKIKFGIPMSKYFILHPDLGIDFILWYHNTRKDSKQTVSEFKDVKSQIEDVIKELSPASNISIESLKQNLDALYNHIHTFMDKLESEKYPSKSKPYPSFFSAKDSNGLLLYLLCKLLKPEKVVETGVAYGVSSSHILQALDENNRGALYSIDYSFRPWQSREMLGAIIPPNMRSRWNLVYGKTSKKLKPLLDSTGPIDIFIHDSSHTYSNMMFEFNTAWSAIKKDVGILISDDISFNNAFYDFCNQRDAKPIIFSQNADRKKYLGIIKKN